MSIECPGCNETSLQYQFTTVDKPYIETWECDCGYVQCFHVQKKQDKYPGFDEFVKRIGWDVIDSMGKVEAMQVAFLGGRNYEAQRDLDALKDLNFTKRQA